MSPPRFDFTVAQGPRACSLRDVCIAMDSRRLLLAVFAVAFQYFSADKVTTETGRTARVGMSERQEMALGLQSYQQVLAQSQTIDSGRDYDTVKRVASRLAAVTGPAAKNFDWRV